MYAQWCERWWEYVERFLVDLTDGSWRHELDENNQPSAAVWAGKPDVYHAYQATILTRARPGSSVGVEASTLRPDQ